MEQAFARLRNHARNHNLRLADVAQAIIDGSLIVRIAPSQSPAHRS